MFVLPKNLASISKFWTGKEKSRRHRHHLAISYIGSGCVFLYYVVLPESRISVLCSNVSVATCYVNSKGI